MIRNSSGERHDPTAIGTRTDGIEEMRLNSTPFVRRVSAPRLSARNDLDGRLTHRRGPKPLTSCDTIYLRALEMVDAEGPDGLTVRHLAADLQISTRTLYKRIRSRDAMLRNVAVLHARRLDLEIHPADSWDLTAAVWCTQLRDALIRYPYASDLLGERLFEYLPASIEDLVHIVAQEGVPRRSAIASCRSLVGVTVNDSLAEVRYMLNSPDDAAEYTAQRGQRFAETIDLLLEGIRRQVRVRRIAGRATRVECASVSVARVRESVEMVSRADEAALAWALVDVARSMMNADQRAMLHVKIGGGDHGSAIRDVLVALAVTGASLPERLIAQLNRWVAGFANSGDGMYLRQLVDSVGSATSA